MAFVKDDKSTANTMQTLHSTLRHQGVGESANDCCRWWSMSSRQLGVQRVDKTYPTSPNIWKL